MNSHNTKTQQIDPVQECADAAQRGDVATLKKYIDSGQVDKDVIDPKTKKALLHLAGNDEVVKYLITKKADLNIRSQFNNHPNETYRNTQLHFAVWYRNYTMAKLLLENGAEVNLRNSAGDTPICLLRPNDKKATEAELRKLTKLLLERGADLTVEVGGKNVIQRLTKKSNGNPIVVEEIDEYRRNNNAFGELALTRKVKESEAKNKMLEEKVERLEKKIEELEGKLAELETSPTSKQRISIFNSSPTQRP